MRGHHFCINQDSLQVHQQSLMPQKKAFTLYSMLLVNAYTDTDMMEMESD